VASAGLAGQADIGAEAIDPPRTAAAGMLPTQSDDIANEEREHRLVV
jgi:hypothetical protein